MKKQFKKVISIILSVVLVLSMFSATTVSVFAADTENGSDKTTIPAVRVVMEGTPVAGENPFYNATLTTTGCSLFTPTGTAFDDYIVNGIMWYDSTAKKYLLPTDTFTEDHTYNIKYLLLADPDKMFDPPSSTLFFYNGSGANGYTNVATYPMSEAVTITKIAAYTINERPDICTINTQSCTAYNSAGEVVYTADIGETIRVIPNAPSLTHTFKGWKVEPSDLEYTLNGTTLTFTAINGDVSIEAEFEDQICDDVYLNLGKNYKVGDQIPFAATFMDYYYRYYMGYALGTPEGADTTNFHNNIRWYDETANEYKAPGDVFERDHIYTITVNVKANNFYCFDSISNMTVYLQDLGDADSITGDENYLTITKGNIKPLRAHNIYTKHAVARNDAGEIITSANPGETVNIIKSPPLDGAGAFKNWIVEPANLEYTEEFGVVSFTMPNDDVSFSADFETTECNYIFVGLGAPFMVGEELPFDIYTMDGERWFTGYELGTADGVDTTNYYNHIRWYDTTDWEYKQPGDVFEDGHSYAVYVRIKATEFCHFPDVNSINVSFGALGEPQYGADTYYGADPSKYITTAMGSIKPEPLNKIEIANGTAYNSKGEVIKGAYPGDVITVVAKAPFDVQSFGYWYDVDYEGDIIFDNIYEETTTFVMPERDVEIGAYFENRPIYGADFKLEGFYQGNRSDKMELTAQGNTEGFYIIPYDEYTPYQIYLNNDNNEPNSWQFTGDFYYTYYWLSVELAAKDGYGLQLENENLTITVNGKVLNAQKIEYTDNGAMVYFMIEAPEYVAINEVYVDGGIAIRYGEEITQAPVGTKIYIIPEEDTSERIFDKWVVDFGDIELITTDDGLTYFIMPDSYVGIHAKFKGAIYSVYVNDITFPVAGERPDYDLTVFSEDGYEIYAANQYWRVNGVRWFEEPDPLSGTLLDPETAVFEEGKTYLLDVTIEAKDGYWFAIDENGNYNVSAYVDGSYAEVGVYNEEITKYMQIYFRYTVPKKYNITVEGGKAYNPRGDATGAPTGGDGEPVTEAYPGTYLKIVADEAPEGYEFNCWIVMEGQLKIDSESLLQSTFWLDMPVGNVTLRAVFIHSNHEFDHYKFNADYHWQMCACNDMIPNTLEEHSFDNSGNCVCGAGHFDAIFYFGESQIFGVTVVEQGQVTRPADPGREEMEFIGWYTADGELYDFAEPVTENVYLYASFRPNDPEKIGDLNEDGSVDIRDLVRMKKILAGIAVPTENTADINFDFIIDAADLAASRKIILLK